MKFFNKAHPFWQLLFLSLSFLTLVNAGTIPNNQRTAILITDWGTPDGMDKDYFLGVGPRSRFGPQADQNIPAEQQQCIGNYVGVWPYLGAIGIMPYAVAYDPKIYDTWGVYKIQSDGSYVNILDSTLVISAAEGEALKAEGKVMPVTSYESNMDRSRAFFGLDKRKGDTIEEGAVNVLADYFKIMGANGIHDLAETDYTYWVRALKLMNQEYLAKENPYSKLMEEEVTAALNALFGGWVDVRFGMYEAVKGLSQREDDVAVAFAQEGFNKMIVTRETTDYNNYADKFLTYNYIETALCNAGFEDKLIIGRVNQVGRTPEYNTLLVNTLKPAFDKFPDGAEIAVVYMTHGLPYATSKAASDYVKAGKPIGNFCVNHPWAQEVYHENCFYNYLNSRAYIERAFDKKYGGKYNLNFHKATVSEDCDYPDCRMNTLFGYGMFPPYPYCGNPLDPDRFQTVRDVIESLKAQPNPPRHVLLVVSHWYFNSVDTAQAMREMNNIPLSSDEELKNEDYMMEWCEGPTTAAPDASVTGDRRYIETYKFVQKTKQRGNFQLNTTGGCSDAGYIHMVVSEAFDKDMADFARGYAGVIRGAVERLGTTFPLMVSLGLTIDKQGPISKLNGGTVKSTFGRTRGAKLEVPQDPAPDLPDSLTYTDVFRPAGSTDPNPAGVKLFNDPTKPWEAAWEDFTAYIGTQRKALNPADPTQAKIKLPAGPQGLKAVSKPVYFGPYRTFFNKPATITLPYNKLQVNNPDNIRPYIYNDITGDYDPVYPVIGGVDATNNIVINADGTASFSVQALGIFVLAE